MKHDPSRDKKPFIGGGSTEPVDIGAGSGDAPIGGGTSNDKLPKAWPNRLPHIPESRAEDGSAL